MARLQILELPEGSNDDRPPFVLVIDQASEDSPLIADGPDIWLSFKNDTGCQHVIVTTETIDIPANDTSAYLTPPAKQELVVNLSGDPDAIRDAIAADMQKLRDANEQATNVRDQDAELRVADEWIERLHAELEELRQQARQSEEAEATRKRVAKKQKADLTDALGMDRLRDWDDIRNAAAGLRRDRDAKAETLEQIRRLPAQPETIDAKRLAADYLNGYAYAMRAAKRATYSPQPTEASEIGPADA